MPIPSVFVAGCMKAGTTVMFDFLTTHPALMGSGNKEVHYFTFNSHRGLAWYAAQFPTLTGDQRAVDASPSYFHLGVDANVPLRITSISPGAKAIVMVRDPVDRAVSHFRHLRRHDEAPHLGGMDADEFFTWDLADVVSEHGHVNYLRNLVLRFSLLHRPLQSYWNAFRRDLLVVPMRALAEDGHEVMATVFEHVGATPFDSAVFSERRYSAEDTDELSRSSRVRLDALFADDWAETLKLAAHVNLRRLSLDRAA